MIRQVPKEILNHPAYKEEDDLVNFEILLKKHKSLVQTTKIFVELLDFKLQNALHSHSGIEVIEFDSLGEMI